MFLVEHIWNTQNQNRVNSIKNILLVISNIANKGIVIKIKKKPSDTSGGRVVAGSNPVIPTTDYQEVRPKVRPLFYCDDYILITLFGKLNANRYQS